MDKQLGKDIWEGMVDSDSELVWTSPTTHSVSAVSDGLVASGGRLVGVSTPM